MRPSSAAALGGLGAFGLLQWLGRSYGATRRERRRNLPGDELVVDPRIVTTHAITVEAAPTDVWPWLVQMGWHRAGWYTARWVDYLLLVPADVVMARQMLRGVRRRAEAAAPSARHRVRVPSP